MDLFVINFLIWLNILCTVGGILIPNGGIGGNCGCPVSQPCPPPQPAPSCPSSSPAIPCPCSTVVARSGGRKFSGGEINPINLGEKETLIALAGKNIRRSPIKKSDPQLVGRDSSIQFHSDTMDGNAKGISESSTQKNVESPGEEVMSVVDGGQNEQSKCNSQVLKKLMIENMNETNSNESKRSINAAAEHKFGGIIDVICSRGHFSYVYSSSLFCETSKGEMTCIAFRQASQS